MYRALELLRGDRVAIATLFNAYARPQDGQDLEADIRDNFSAGELEYGLQSMGIGLTGLAQELLREPTCVVSDWLRNVRMMPSSAVAPMRT